VPGASARIDFAPRRNGSRRVRVLAARTGQPIPGVAIDLWSANGQRVDTIVSNDDGYAYPTAPQTTPADYRLSTYNTLGLVEQVYPNILCPQGSVYFGLCSLTGGTPVTFPSSSTVPMIFTMGNADDIFSSGFEP
jgi:hypothetical protein